MPKYEVRVREELKESDLELAKSADEIFGATQVSKIITYRTNEVSGVQEILDNLKTSTINTDAILSIIAIDSDNSDQLGEDFDWERV